MVLVCDNLNTHHPSVLYEAFPPAEARIAARLEWHYTPKHGSWLNIAEIEFAALAAQCLDRCIASEVELRTEIEAWVRAQCSGHAHKLAVHNRGRPHQAPPPVPYI